MVRWAVSCARFGCFGATERMPSAFSSSSVPPLPSTDDRTLPGCGTNADVRKGATIPTRRHQQNCGQVYTQAPAALSLCCRPARVRHCACWTSLPTLSGITLTYTHVFPRRCVLPSLCVHPSACKHTALTAHASATAAVIAALASLVRAGCALLIPTDGRTRLGRGAAALPHPP